MQGKYILKIDEISTYDIKIENIEEMKNSIFIDAYKEAYRNLNSIIEAQNQKKKNKDKFIDKSINNIIAFIGERGSGKTSCMKSFLRAIENNEYLESEMENRIKVNFEILDMIEPSFFTDKINIIELVISNLFKKFSEELEKKELEDYEKKKKLLNEFQEIFKALKYMGCKEEYQNSEIEELLMLSTTVSFKEKLQGLIKSYLEFIKKDKLVISVDDIDFNMNHAYEMVEGIRKYLTLDDVVIIINLKMEQLNRIIEEKYIEDFRNIIGKTKNIDGILREIDERKEQYLCKFLPFERRVYLKELEEYNFNIFLETKGKKIEFKSKEAICKYILKISNVDILKLKDEIPNNLREMINFISIIKELRKDNKEILWNYFYKKYFFKLKMEDKNKIKKLLLLEDYSKINNYIISNLKNDNYINNWEFISEIKPNYLEESLSSVVKCLKELEENYELQTLYMKILIEMKYCFYLEEVYNKIDERRKLFGNNFLQENEEMKLGKIKEELENLKKEFDSKDLEIVNLFIINNKKEKFFSIVGPIYNGILYEKKYQYKLKSLEAIYKLCTFIEEYLNFEKDKKIYENIVSFYNRMYDFIKKEKSFERNFEMSLEKMIKELKELDELAFNKIIFQIIEVENDNV